MTGWSGWENEIMCTKTKLNAKALVAVQTSASMNKRKMREFAIELFFFFLKITGKLIYKLSTKLYKLTIIRFSTLSINATDPCEECTPGTSKHGRQSGGGEQGDMSPPPPFGGWGTQYQMSPPPFWPPLSWSPSFALCKTKPGVPRVGDTISNVPPQNWP